MRLICPSCGAQYEVDDTLIPDEGRDVQCSNCGTGWFQHPPHLQSDEADALGTNPELDDGFYDEPDDEDGTLPPEDEPVKSAAASRMDAGVRSILIEEAAREARARRGEPLLDTQTDLGIEDPRRRPAPQRPEPFEEFALPRQAAEAPPKTDTAPEEDILAQAIAASGPIPPAAEYARSLAEAARAAPARDTEAPLQQDFGAADAPPSEADAAAEDLAAGARYAAGPFDLPAETSPAFEPAPAPPEPAPPAPAPDLNVAPASMTAPPPPKPAGTVSEAAPSFARVLAQTDDHSGQDSGEAGPDAADLPLAENAEKPAPSRRDLLPDIEEINSSLHSAGGAYPGNSTETAAGARGGFGLGFMTVVILALIAVLIYAFAAALGRAVPALEPALAGYVDWVDALRIWLDETVRGWMRGARG